ncbi:MAG TPA: hypothetical protein VD736_02450 [Nitrososphaera sp.]|nr:hypothetical protein [Nitrososphaera sp.]
MLERRKVKIDRAIYLVDDSNKTYRFLERNPSWKNLAQGESSRNKRSIDGYARIFHNSGRKIFRYRAT